MHVIILVALPVLPTNTLVVALKHTDAEAAGKSHIILHTGPCLLDYEKGGPQTQHLFTSFKAPT